MRKEDLFNALGQIDDDLLEAANNFRKVNKKKFPVMKVVAVAAAVSVFFVSIFGATLLGSKLKSGDKLKGETPNNVEDFVSSENSLVSKMEEIPPQFIMSEAKYPTMAAYPDYEAVINGEMKYEEYKKLADKWEASVNKQTNQFAGYGDGMEEYYRMIVNLVMANNDELDVSTDNIVCSPINIYVALGMLSEITVGETREQLLDLLGVETIDDMRLKVSALWNANYRDDGATALLLGNSLWLNQFMKYDEPTLDIMSKYYFSSVYRGEMGTAEYNDAYHTWINNHTGGILKDYINTELTYNTVMSLVSTVYFSDKWEDSFNKEDTITDTFYGNAEEITCDFLTKKEAFYNYFKGDGYEAVELPFQTNGNMWIVLPDEEYSALDVLTDDEKLSYILSSLDGENEEGLQYTKVNLKLPKFSVSSQISLEGTLESLGIDDILGDFDTDIVGYLNSFQINHAAKVEVNEEGCEAAAYTEEILEGSAITPSEVIEFNVDRPFLFAIKGVDGSVLFAGIVNNPLK